MTKAGYDLGFVGLGRMGGPMVGRLLDAGHAVTVFDISEPAVRSMVERGAAPAGSAAEVAAAAEIVMTSLPTPDTVHRVALGAAGIAHGARVRTVVDLSTTGPSTATRAAEGLGARGIQWVDAPVSGGDQGRARGHARGDGVLPQAHARGDPADPRDLRQDLLRRREAGPRPGRQARQQPARRRGAGGLLRSARHGGQGRARPRR